MTTATLTAVVPFCPPLRWRDGWTALVERGKALLCGLYFLARSDAERRGDPVPTDELIRRFQRGQSQMFEALYDRYKDYVYRVALFATRNGSLAEEAVQETFLDVLRALPRYRLDGPARFETWLYRVTVNRCRSLQRRQHLPLADWDDVEQQLERLPSTHRNGDPEGAFLRRERAVALWRAVDRLPPNQREVVFLRYQQGLSYAEIAAALDVNEGTVKSRLYYAHQNLKEQLETPGDE